MLNSENWTEVFGTVFCGVLWKLCNFERRGILKMTLGVQEHVLAESCLMISNCRKRLETALASLQAAVVRKHLFIFIWHACQQLSIYVCYFTTVKCLEKFHGISGKLHRLKLKLKQRQKRVRSCQPLQNWLHKWSLCSQRDHTCMLHWIVVACFYCTKQLLYWLQLNFIIYYWNFCPWQYASLSNWIRLSNLLKSERTWNLLFLTLKYLGERKALGYLGY